MRKIIVILVFSALTFFFQSGCTTKFGKADPEQKHALRTLAGGVAGALVTGNAGGAIIGALVLDVYSINKVKYEDKQLENGQEAAERYKNIRNGEEKKAEKKKEIDKLGEKKEDNKKAEEKKLGEKKEDEKKVEEGLEKDRKIGAKKDEEKKAEEKTDKDKKLGERKEDEKKVEEGIEKDRKIGARKKDEKRVELIIEESLLAGSNVSNGSTVEANVQYTLLAPSDIHQITITETRILSSAEGRMELDKREVIRTQGTYSSKITFTVPDDIPRGYCILFTTISDGKRSKTTKSVFNVI